MLPSASSGQMIGTYTLTWPHTILGAILRSIVRVYKGGTTPFFQFLRIEIIEKIGEMGQ